MGVLVVMIRSIVIKVAGDFVFFGKFFFLF